MVCSLPYGRRSIIDWWGPEERFTIPSEAVAAAPRRVIFAGRTLTPGRHEVRLPEATAWVVVGERPGPRAVVVGGMEAGDTLGLATARRVLEAVDSEALAGSLVLAPRVSRSGLAKVLEGAAFAVELRAGPPGWSTAPHLRADLRTPRAAMLARGFGAAVVVSGATGALQLRYEAGERGRADADAVADAWAGVMSLLAARGLVDATPRRPAMRLVVGEVVRVRVRSGGTLVAVAAPGAQVVKGGGLVAVYDARGRERALVSASHRSVLLATRASTEVPPRALVARVGLVRSATRAGVPSRVCGWCEWVGLPELGIARLHAKIDTGARTSALHVRGMREVGGEVEVVLPGRRALVARVAVVDHVVVRDSGGHAERRPLIETTLVLGPVRRKVRLTLTDRGDMQFPMLVGRSALGDDVWVDASRRDILG